MLAATRAKYMMTFFVFSVFPAPDSPLVETEEKVEYIADKTFRNFMRSCARTLGVFRVQFQGPTST